MSDLFSGIPIREFESAARWYEQLFGFPPAFFPNEIEAVWKLAEHQYVYIVQIPEQAGHAIIMQMVDDIDQQISAISERGIRFEREENFPNNICKVTYRDSDGNQISFGGTRHKTNSE